MTINIDYEATLLRADGDEYEGGTLVKKLGPRYNTHRGVVVQYMDNTFGFMEMGQQTGRIDSMTIECFNHVAAAQIQSDIANEDNEGNFLLRVPNFAIDGTEGGKEYTIRFFEAKFQPQTVRRGNTQIFSAQVSDIQVLDEDTYS